VQLLQETRNLFRLTRLGMINCFFVREDDGLTLVDTGLAGSAPGIRKAPQGLGAPICRILLTHAHMDHLGSLDALVGECPGIEFAVGQRESRLLLPDFSLEPGETGKKLIGFPGSKSHPTRLLNDGDCVGSLQSIFSAGHTPGHVAYLDVRDGSLIAGDAFTTQTGVVAAGTFKLFFLSLLFSRGIERRRGKHPEIARSQAGASCRRPRPDHRGTTCGYGSGH
jgi:glyoxylase-like metal-dependent hydrolase (beta-lactamase superfamily II)